MNVTAKMNFQSGEVEVSLDTEGLEKDIEYAIRDAVEYRIKNQIELTISDWVGAIMTEKKEEIMKALKPKVDEVIGAVRVSRY